MHKQAARYGVVVRLRGRHQLHQFAKTLEGFLIQALIGRIIDLHDAPDVGETAVLPGELNQVTGGEYRQAVKIQFVRRGGCRGYFAAQPLQHV